MSRTTPPSLHKSFRAEYELIQSKIDHVGGFKFRVRGWSLTLQAAVFGALLSGKIGMPISTFGVIAVGTGTIGFVFLFHFLEQEQEAVSRGLKQRASDLEKAIDQLTVDHGWSPSRKRNALRRSLDAIISTPRIAATMKNAARAGLFRNLREMWRGNVYAFYFMQYFLAVLFLVFIFFFSSMVKRPKQGLQTQEKGCSICAQNSATYPHQTSQKWLIKGKKMLRRS